MSGQRTKIDDLYDALKKDGAVSKSREYFNSKMLAPGEEGYKNRLQLYNALKEDGAIESETYEEFASKLGLHAVEKGAAKDDGTQTATASPSDQQQSKPQNNTQSAAKAGGQQNAKQSAQQSVPSQYVTPSKDPKETAQRLLNENKSVEATNMPPQASRNNPTQQKNVMPLEQRKKLWTWQNITIPTTEAEYKTFMRRLKEEDKRVKDRNDPDEIEAFKGFVNDLSKEQIRIKKGGKVAVKTGNRSFGEGDGLEVRPFGYSKADFSKELQGQDYVLTVRTMAQAKPIYNLEYNVKDPEVRKDYEVLKWQGEGGLPYTVTDYMIDAAPKDKAKYYNLYAAYIYDQVGEIPDWVDYQDALRIRALDKSQLDKDSKEFVRLAEETKDKRKVRGANNVADYYNNLFFLKNGDRRIGNGVSYAPIVSGDGSLQIVAVDVTGRPTVADNRAAYNNLFKQSNEGLVGSGKPKVEMLPTGRAYAVPDITNEERYYANIPKWKDLSDAERAPYKDEVDYIYQMQRGQAKQGVYYVEPGQNVEVEAAKYAKRLAQDQYKLLTDKEKMQAALKQAKDTYKQLEDVQRSIFEKNQKFVHVGEEGIVLSPAYYELKSLLERYKNFIDVAPRYMEGRHYSAALQFWNGLTDIDGATFGLAGLIDAANMNLVATNPPKELIEKFGSKKAAEKVIATAIAMKNKTEEFKTELGAYGESHSLGALMQFFMLSSTPLFRATDAVGGFVTRRTARFLGKLSKGLGKLTPKATQSLAAEGTKLVDVGFKEGIRAAAQEGGLCGASTYALGRVGAPVRTVTSQVLGKGVQGSLEGAVLSVPKVFADVYNNRTGQANITAETREGIEVDSEHPFTHYGLKSDEAVAKDAFMREWSQWVGMRLGEVVGCPLSRAVDGKVAAGAKKAWDATMGKFVNTSSYQKISGFFSKMKKSAEIGKAITDVGKYVGENMKRAGMGGTMTFYAQTNLSEMLNAMTVGDVKWDQIASIPEQVDKLWGAAVSNAFMVGIHNVVGTAGYYKQKRDLARHLTESDARGLEAWGKEDWDGIKSDIETLSQSDKNLQAYAQGVLGNEKLTDAQKSAIMDYATTVLTQKTFGLIASQGEGKNKPNEYDLRYDDAYNAGYQVKSPDEMSRMRESLDAARKTLAEKMGITAEEVDAAFSDGSKTLGEKYNEAVKNYTETHNADGTAPKLVEEFERALDQYFTAMSAQRGVSEALVDSETEAVRRTDAIIDRSTNDKTGVIEHGVDSNGRQCIVVSGDPKSEDKSQMLVVVYADNGEVKGVPTNEITVTRQSDPQEAKDQQIDAIHANYENTRKSIADGTTFPEQGDKIVLYDGENKKTVTIDGVRQEQTNEGVKNFVEVTTEDGIKRSLPEEVYRQYAKAGFEKTSADWVYGEGRYANESERRNPEEQSEDPTQLTGEGTSESGNSDSPKGAPTWSVDTESSEIKVGETFVDSDGKRFTVKSVDGDKFVVVDGEGNEQTYEDGIFNQMVENGLLKRDASENTASTWGVGSKLEINGHEYKVLRVDEANDRVYLEDENGEAMQLPWVLSGLNDSIKNGRAHVIEDTGESPNGNEEVSTSSGEGQGESAGNPANAQPGVVPTESVTPGTAQTDPMPMRTVGKGKNARQEEDWLATSPQRGHDYIFGETGLDADEANAFVENMAAEAKKNLEKVQKNAPKMGTSISEYKAAKTEHEALVAEAQKAVDYWNDVKAVHAKRAFEAEKPKEEGAASVDSAHKVDENNEKTSDVNLEPVGKGVFGNIYDQFKGKAKAAIDFLKKLGGGEAVAALYHKEVGDISLVWGNDKAGLKKILHKHPEVVDDLQGILDEMHVVQSSDNRIVLESNTHKAVVSKKLGQEETPQWLLTAYEKKDASGGSSDIDPEPNKGKQNGTAPLQDNPSSESKVTKLRNKYKEVRKKLAELGIFEESNAMSLMEYQPRANTGSGKMPLSIAKLVKKKVERVLDNPNSTKQDLHDAIRFVMHDGSEVMATTTLFDSLYKIFDAYKDGKLSKEDFLVFLSHSIWCDLDKANDLYEFFYPQWKSQDNAETPAEEKWNSSVVKANNDVDGKPTENSSVPLEITTKGNSAEDSRPIVPKEGEKVGVAEGEKSSGTGDAVPSKEETNDGDKKTKSTSSEKDAVPSETGTNEGDKKAKIDGLLKQLDDPNISPYHKKKIGDELFSLTVQPLSMKLLEAVRSGDTEAVKEAQKDFADLLRIFPPEQLEHIVRQTEFVRNYKKAGENDKAEVTRLVVNIAKKEIGKREKSLLQGANKESGYDWSQYKKGDLVRVKDALQTDGLNFYGTNAIFDHLLIDRHGNVTGVVVYVPSKLGGGEYTTIFGDSFMKKARLVKSETDGSKSETTSKGKSLREDDGAEVEQQSESVGTSLFGEPLHKENESSEQKQTQTVKQSQGESGDVQTESGRLPGRSSGDRKYAEGSGNDEKSVRMRKATERVAEMLGTKVVWDDTIEKSNGYYDPKTNTIHVAKDAGNPLEAVFGHESLHRVRSLSEDAYNSLLNAVKKFVGEDAFKEAAQKKYDFYNSHGVKTSMDGAAEEVVGDEVGRMLDDKDYAEKLAYNLKHPVLSAIKDFLTQIKDAIVKAFGGGSEEARKVNDLLRTINKAYRKAVKEADRKPLKAGEDILMENGKVAAQVDGELNVRPSLSLRTYNDWTDEHGVEHQGTRGRMVDFLTNKGFDKRDIDRMTENMDYWHGLMQKVADFVGEDGRFKFPAFHEWSQSTPLYRKYEDSVTRAVSTLVNNGEYPLNFELTTDCIKREAFTQILNEMLNLDDAAWRKLTPAKISDIQTLEKSYGIQVACPLCFVEGKRLNIMKWATSVVKKWNQAVADVTGDKKTSPFGFGKGTYVPEEVIRDGSVNYNSDVVRQVNEVDRMIQSREGVLPEVLKQMKLNDEELRQKLEQFRDEYAVKHGSIDGFRLTDKQEKELVKLRNQNLRGAVARMAKAIAAYPELRHRLQVEDLVGSKGLMAIRAQDSPAFAEMYSSIVAANGTGTPKLVQDSQAYDGEIIDVSDTQFNNASVVGGARLFSFSDFDLTKVFDIMQIMWDCAARNAKVQSYSKEVPYIVLFGKCGVKINMSMLPEARPEEGLVRAYKDGKNKTIRDAALHAIRENAGLEMDKDGHIKGIQLSDSHSVSKEFAESIFHNDDYNANCGAIMVGISVNHTIYSMCQDFIRQVIPFHLSGMPIASRKRSDCIYYRDATNEQNTGIIDKDGKRVKLFDQHGKSRNPKVDHDFNFYEGENKPGWNMRDRCREYIKWCQENGCIPRFEWAVNSDGYRAFCEREGYKPNEEIIRMMDERTTDGVFDEYYKVITDYTAYQPIFDENGNMIGERPAPHKAVSKDLNIDKNALPLVLGVDENGKLVDDQSMLANREKSIANASQNKKEIAQKAVMILNGTAKVGDLVNKSGTEFENNSDSDKYLGGNKKYSLREDETFKSPNEMSDEEKSERGQKLINAPAIEVKSNQIVKTENMSARRVAEKWWNENVGDSLFYDTEVGKVEINENSIGSSLAHRYGQAKLDAITSLKDGFKNAVYLGTIPDFVRQEGVQNHYFAYPIIYNGKRNYVFCRAMQDANKNRLYVHEVFIADKLQNEGNTLQTAASQPHGGIALYKAILSDVLSTAKVGNNSESSNISDENSGKRFSLREGDDEQPTGGVAKKDRVKQIVDETMERLAKLNEEKNEKRADAKAEAAKVVGGTLRAINKAMSAQREYDLHTVDSITKLAKDMLKHGLLHGLSDYEASRLFSAATNVHGKKDIKPYVQKVMDIMVNNQLGNLKDGLSKLLMMRGKKVNASGVEVQGGLDLDGQHLADTVWHGLGMTEEDIQTQMADAQDRMGDENRVIAHNAEVEYQAYRILQNYHDGVVKSKSEEQALRQELKKAKEDYDAKRMSFDDYVEFREATENAIRENRMDRIEAYRDVMASLGGEYGESAKRAKEFRESEKERINEIHHNANSDMEGRPAEEHHQPTKVDKAANNPLLRILTAPLGTFDQMLRMFGRKNVRGEGYLWNRYMRGWNDARDNEVKGYRGAIEELDNKVKEVLGRKGMKWSDLFALERKLPKGYVSFMDGGEKKTHELTQGNLLYIYMVNKMTDGKMKLRKMGISEEDVKQIEDFLDPRLKQIGDWLQDEYLVKKREKYNEVHEKLFGASMADIDNYFPLKILKNAITQDVNLEDRGQGDEKVSTIVGSVKKRTRNALPLDVMNADAFAVVLEHLKDMEHFAAFGEWNRDLNTLLSYNRFRVQVENMASVYGSGKKLWKAFENVCQIAAGVYQKGTNTFDRSLMAVAKGVTGAKVTGRIFTAFKQLTSYPAYLSEANPIYLIRNLVNPVDAYNAWKWSMENLPQLRERWQGRFAGDPILESNRSEGGGQKGTWERWRENVIELAAKYGMSPNAFVDALTISMGTQAVYKTRLAKYKQMGYSDEAADKRAKQDASIAYNQTQQSSEGAYMSAIQSDRTWATAMFTAFRNSSISYTRQLYDALRRMKDRFTPGYKGLTVEFMRKQMERDGIDPDKASENAKKEYRRGFARDMVRIGVFGYLLQLTWNMIGYAPYLLFGDDDKKKKEMWSDIFTHTMFGSIEGLVGGDALSAGFNSLWRSVFNGEDFDSNKFSKDMPVASDIDTMWRDWKNKGWQVGVTDVFNILVQSAIGVNPQTLTDAAVAIYDYCGADEVTPRECALLVMRIFNCPKSQTDKVYFDELGMTAKEAQKLSVGQIAERYANYKMRSDAPVLSMTYGDDEKKERGSFYRDKAVDAAKENLGYDVSSKEVTDMQNEYAEMKKKVQKIKDLEDEDRDEYLKQMGELVKTPEYRRYKVAARYNGEMNKLTKKFMRAKTTDERKAVINEMQSTRDRWLKVLNSPSE